MAHRPINVVMTNLELTQQEEDLGSILSLAQRKVLQRYKAMIAQELLNLEVDPTNVLIFAQKQAGLKGQLEAIDYIFDLSDSTEARLRTEQQDLSDSQQ